MSNKKRIFFTGGGTGGHVFPGISIIQKLKELDNEIEFFWIGKKKSIEEKLIKEQNNIKFIPVPCGKLRRYFSFQNFTDFFKVILGIIKSFYILKKYKPQIVYATGGFVSTPTIIASSLLKIKRITHEMDLDPGLATKINSKFANKIYTSFKESEKYFKNHKNIIYTGSPIRKEFLTPNPKIIKQLTQNTNKSIVSILGGSLGANVLNNLALFIKKDPEIYFIHQSGKNLNGLREDNYLRRQFFNAEEMASIVKFSNIIISRAGAGAIKEFANACTCVILIPFKKGSRGDQIKNAKLLKNQNACIYIDEDEILNTNILKVIKETLNDREKINSLKENIKKFNNKHSSTLIAKLLIEDIKETKSK